MENFKKVLEKNKLVLTCSTDDDSECESLSDQQSKHYKDDSKEIFDMNYPKPLPSKKRNGEKRLPTRKPDPNVYNRNALLARENRKKKKMYLETIEKELDAIRKENRVLVKALRRQLKIAERLEKEKQYYENIVKNRSNTLGCDNASNFHFIQRDCEKIPAGKTEDSMLKNVIDIPGSRSCSPQEDDNVSMLLDSASDGSVVAPRESSACDFSSFDFCFPEFFTDLYDSTDVTLPHTCTTWDDIWGDKDYNVDNFISTNSTILQNSADMESLNFDHSYARGSIRSNGDSSDQGSEPCDFIDVEGICSCKDTFCTNGHLFPTYQTPPMQLLTQQSS